MMTQRRTVLTWAGAMAVASIASLPAAAQSPSAFPTKPIRLVVPFPPGGPADTLARVLAQGMGEQLGQSVVVDNKPGANTIIGADLVARAAPDGYTLLLAIDATLTQNPFLYSKLPYDPTKDFTPVGIVAHVANVLAVHPSLPVSNVRQLIELAKQKPGQLQYGYGAVAMQVAGETFNQLAGVKLGGVPYKGGSTTVMGLMGGDVPVIFDGATGVLNNAASGKVKPIAVLGSRRLSVAPDLPTVAESGLPGYDVTIWQSLVAPAATPRPVVERLNVAMRAAMAPPSVQSRLENLGIQANPTSPEEMVKVMAADTQKWGPLIRTLGIKID